MPPTLTTEQFVAKARIVHHDLYNYDMVVYISTETAINITCQKHGSFQQRPSAHIRGQGCSVCKIVTSEKYIEKAKEVHGARYDYSKLNYKARSSDIVIICSIHGEFTQNAGAHLVGSGCSLCCNESRVKIKDLNEFIKEAKKVHVDEKYDYTRTVYVSRTDKIEIICKIHGTFYQEPAVHLRGHGCLKCGQGIASDPIAHFIQEAQLIHGETYDYSLTNYEVCNENVIIVCKIHGAFSQTPANHLHGHGCQKCGGSAQSNTTEFCAKSKLVHGDIYEYSKVNYVHSHGKVVITCSFHGDFLQRPVDHLQGAGCSHCTNKTEGKFKTFLLSLGVDVVSEAKFDWNFQYRFDFFVENNHGSFLFEIDGDQHFKDINAWKSKSELVMQRDVTKMKLAILNNYTIIRLCQMD
jgi:hypothetical protein